LPAAQKQLIPALALSQERQLLFDEPTHVRQFELHEKQDDPETKES
jgi:hypothetical protein